MSFRFVQKSLTFNDFERRNGRYFVLFQQGNFGLALRKVVEGIPKLSATEM